MDTKSGHHLREKGKMTNLNLSNTCQMHPRERKRGGGGECISGCGHVDAIIGSSCWALLLLLLLLLDANSGLPARDSSSVAGEGAGMSELRRKVPLIPHNWVKQNRAYIHRHNVLETFSGRTKNVNEFCMGFIFGLKLGVVENYFWDYHRYMNF